MSNQNPQLSERNGQIPFFLLRRADTTNEMKAEAATRSRRMPRCAMCLAVQTDSSTEV